MLLHSLAHVIGDKLSVHSANHNIQHRCPRKYDYEEAFDRSRSSFEIQQDIKSLFPG